MRDSAFYVRESPMDTDRFGMCIAKAYVCSPADAESALAFCRDHVIATLIVRCDIEAMDAVHYLEDHNARLMDSLVYFSRDLQKYPFETPPQLHEVRPIRPGEEDAVIAIARQSFQGYHGHYHTDPRLPREACDAIYTDWAYRSCISEDVASNVYVACADNQIAGFLTVRNEDTISSEFVLSGVHLDYQRKGIYHSLIAHGLHEAQRQGMREASTSTQAFNRAVQKTWMRLGMVPDRMYYTFHVWFS